MPASRLQLSGKWFKLNIRLYTDYNIDVFLDMYTKIHMCSDHRLQSEVSESKGYPTKFDRHRDSRSHSRQHKGCSKYRSLSHEHHHVARGDGMDDDDIRGRSFQPEHRSNHRKQSRSRAQGCCSDKFWSADPKIHPKTTPNRISKCILYLITFLIYF